MRTLSQHPLSENHECHSKMPIHDGNNRAFSKLIRQDGGMMNSYAAIIPISERKCYAIPLYQIIYRDTQLLVEKIHSRLRSHYFATIDISRQYEAQQFFHTKYSISRDIGTTTFFRLVASATYCRRKALRFACVQYHSYSNCGTHMHNATSYRSSYVLGGLSLVPSRFSSDGFLPGTSGATFP